MRLAFSLVVMPPTNTDADPAAVVDPIKRVEARMEAIAAPLAAADGVMRFNELYLAVTRAVAAEAGSEAYEDPAFISRLDVVFADLYFGAVDDDAAGRKPPKAWEPLFEKRHTKGIAPLQFAIAGMNAHINHDLAVCLVDVCDEWTIGLDTGTPQHRDYLAVNKTLERVEGEVKARYTTGVLGDVDKAMGPLDDVLANWSVARARDNAWTIAQTIRALRGKRFVYEQFMAGLARNVGFAGRALLVRTEM
jgi:Family of unknown function (DUF5995)